jgi:hypothetical protein
MSPVRITRLVAIGLMSSALFTLAATQQPERGNAPEFELAVGPERATPVRPGVSRWVHVFYEHPGRENPGRPNFGTTCATNDDSQVAWGRFGSAKLGGLAFQFKPGGVPGGVAGSFETAMQGAFGTWNSESPNYFSKAGNAGSASPIEDGVNTIGWIRLVPKNVLAAAWTWVDDSTGRIKESDIFFNTGQPFAVYSDCATTASTYEVGNIATHELGHAVGLDHVSDAGKQATMYPSAPKGEVIKRSLTTGDRTGFQSSLAGS